VATFKRIRGQSSPEYAVYDAIKGFEGSWLGWLILVGFLFVGISVSKGNLRSWAYSGIGSIVLLVVTALGVVAQGIVLFDLVVSL
jgi:hypothetical protein